MKKVLSASILAILSASLIACGGSGSSESGTITPPQTQPNNPKADNNTKNSENSENLNNEKNPKTKQNVEDMLPQSKLMVTPEPTLPIISQPANKPVVFAGLPAELKYNNYLSSAEQPKTYVANYAICDSNCMKESKGLITGQLEFNIEPKDGKLTLTNIKLNQLHQSDFDLVGQTQATIKPEMVMPKLTGTISSVDEKRRIFKLDFKKENNEVFLQNIKIAFSEKGGWFTSIAGKDADFFMAGARKATGDDKQVLANTALFDSFDEKEKTGSVYTITDRSGEVFNDKTFKYNFKENFSKAQYRDFTRDGKQGKFANISDGTFVYGFKGDRSDAIQNTGYFVIDPTGNFAVGVEKTSTFTSNNYIFLQN